MGYMSDDNIVFLDVYSVSVVVVKGLRKYHKDLSQTLSPNYLVDMMPMNKQYAASTWLAIFTPQGHYIIAVGSTPNYEHAYKCICPISA